MTGRLILAAAALLGAAALAGAGGARADEETYGVFCANNRIVIDSRSDEQMHSQRSACPFGRFPSRMDAENFVRRNFGEGASCSCR